MKLLCLILFSCASSLCWAQIAIEKAGVKTLRDHKQQGWFWASGSNIPAITDGRAYLFDRQGQMLGQLSTGMWFNSLIMADKRNEIITTETYFSQGTRGERTDYVVIYDPITLSPKRQIVIPSKRMNAVRSNNLAVLTQDQKHLLVVNYTPAQSISIVDLERGEFIHELETPGCSVIYPAGNRDFYSICGNGSFMHIRIDENGKPILIQRTEKLFDAVGDFLTISASQIGQHWYFLSRKNNVYDFKMDSRGVKKMTSWSLVTNDEREDGWQIAGMHHTSTHQKSGKLYVLMQQGEVNNFEDPGSHVWVYDVKTGKKVQSIKLKSLALSINVDQSNKPRIYAMSMATPLPFLFEVWIYLFDGREGIINLLQPYVEVYDAASGDSVAVTSFLPRGYINSVQAW